MARKRTGVTVSTGGSESMRRAKRRPILVGVTEEQHKLLLRAAAESHGGKVSWLVRDAALAEAEKILRKISNRS